MIKCGICLTLYLSIYIYVLILYYVLISFLYFSLQIMGGNKGMGKSKIVPPALRMPKDNESTSFQEPPHQTLVISSHPSVDSTVQHSTQSASISHMIGKFMSYLVFIN